ncbi:MAG: SprB repeat-containing protein [Flavobacteriales bacterium]|nr:SprB repeat-containing protein [Flavobacteriales bacterium]
MRDGTVDATVTGGTPPYSFKWSNGAETEDLTSVSAGYYKIQVMDADSIVAGAEITLVEPMNMKIATEPYVYPNGFNVSCHECYNGSIDVTVYNGVPPYSYEWSDAASTQDRSGLGPMKYAVKVTDANDCIASSETVYLTQPERNDWMMEGNAGTDAGQHFFGTTDEQDVVFKSNSTERLRLLSDGRIRLDGHAAIGKGFLYIDSLGILKGGSNPYYAPSGPCHLLDFSPFWETRGNHFGGLCPEEMPVLGTQSNDPLHIITNGFVRMTITADGKVGIGTGATSGAVDGYRLYVEDGIVTRDVLVKNGPWPDYVFSDAYRLMPMGELRAFVQRNSHLPGIPSASEVEEKGGVEVGDLQRRMLEVVEQQALYILQLEERLARTEQRLTTLEASK